jgi:hypothetical protein
VCVCACVTVLLTPCDLRQFAVSTVCEVAAERPALISDDVLQQVRALTVSHALILCVCAQVGERTRDKKQSVREAALTGLAALYGKADAGRLNDVQWIADKVITVWGVGWGGGLGVHVTHTRAGVREQCRKSSTNRATGRRAARRRGTCVTCACVNVRVRGSISCACDV